ncbi:hypothetical protein CSKR_108986 [Clonorchis sinensis]|uniref:Uncharacterized protein n=1 Tax=Clonorchis sinensis TaxID=79923 RepID=A0A419PV09_CLOSI|nr:hypothetical protein CSKR_108986 [Clonorchis sinensis]
MDINYASSETVDTYPREVPPPPPPPPPPPQYPSQRVRKETSQLRVPSMGCSVEVRSPQSSQRSSAVRQRGITPGRIGATTPTASSANLHSARQVAHQPRIPTRGNGEQRPALVYAPASHASRVLRSIPTPKVGVDKTPTDPKRTPLLSRLLPPGFACATSSPDGSSSTASVQTVRTADESEQADHGSVGHEDRTRRTEESARLTSGDQKPHSQRYKPRAARFAPSHAPGVTSRPTSGPHSGLSERADAVQLKAGQSLTYALRDEIPSYYRHDPTDSGDPEGREDLASSPHSGSTVPSTTESQEALSDKHVYGSDQIPEQKLSSEEGDREEPLRCSADEDDVEGETGSKADDRSPDSETQLTLCAPQVSGFPKMFHRIPHAYVNDEQALAAAELDVNPLFYTGYEDELRLRPANNKVTDTRSELTCVGPPPSYPSTVVVELQAPPLHPKQASFSHIVRTRSQPNLSSDYVNLPEDSLVNWLTTAVTTHYPFIACSAAAVAAAAGYYFSPTKCLHRRKRSSVPNSEDTVTPSISLPPPPPPLPSFPLPPPPPPPYRPHFPMGPRMPIPFMTPRPSVGANVLCHLSNGSFCYAPFPAGRSYTVISTTATTACHAPANLLYFHPNWWFARPPGPVNYAQRIPFEQMHERPTETCGEQVPCETDPSASYLPHGTRPKPGLSNVSRVAAPAAFVISRAPHDHPPRFTIVNGRAMHCSSERGPVSAAVCDSLLGSSKLESASATAGRGVSDSSPSIQNVPVELDIQVLWEENQQLRALLHEATTRLQYVNVLECHLQRLNMLVGSMLTSHHWQCELDHQLHGCPHQEFFPAESRPRAPPPPSQPPPTDWMYPVVPSSLPAVPIAPYYSPGYYPFNMATPAVIPERSIHMGPVQPGWNVRPQMMYAPDSSGRSTRSRVNTSAWPRTVSLDRADGVGGYSSAYSSRWPAANVVPDRRSAQPKKHPKQKTVRVADEPITFSPEDRSQQPLPFRSVQVTRRRLDHSVPASNAHLSPRPSGACETHYCPHSGRELFRETTPLIKYQPPMSSPAQTNRPMDISLINRYPDLEEQEDMKQLTPHTETIPAKIAVSSVYQVASACRVCLADSGVHSGDSQTQLAPVGQTGIVVSTTLSNTYIPPPQIGSSLQSPTDYAIHSSAGGPSRYVFAVSGTQPNVETQLKSSFFKERSAYFVDTSQVRTRKFRVILYGIVTADSRPVANSVNAASEADGSGSYEGITLPQPTHAQRPSEANLPHSTQTTTSTSDSLPTTVPFTANEQSAQVHFAHHTPSTLSPKLRFSSPSFTHSPAHGGPAIRTKHSEHFPFSEASPEAIYSARSPTSPLSMKPTMASERSQDTAGRTGQFPGYCFGGSTKVNEVLFDPLQADSRYAPHLHRQGPHAAHHPVFQSGHRTPGLQVHFAPRFRPASSIPHSTDKVGRNMAPSEQTSTGSCNFPIDSIVSPHLLRKHYCYEEY